MNLFHPWRWLHDRHARIDIVWHELPGNRAGYWDGARTIVLDPRLTQAARRSTLAHELVHVERGIIPIEPTLIAREEAAVDEIAARQLITIDALVDALRWCQRCAGAALADEVWTDQHALNVRLATLTRDERAQIEAALADTEWAA
ncbi:ImmA/IrrE family metallo-endopeptidase [Gordonia sp. SND2]|uniref:ImmA/IrrE family metallo-endopeptidase n=1 Tax=Gordonia sp. SND2 TaxID=3388659 RepID=UPI00398B0942